ncbi:MAG: M14 family metallopeptidase [bacterium]|nr:M14 family metallopeptidase [bacterium]
MKRILLSLVVLFVFSNLLFSQVQSPDDFLGFPLGADRQLADYHQIVKYLELLGEHSPKIKIDNLGKTTDGNDMIIAIISSPDNIQQLEKYRQISYELAHPYNLSSTEAEELIAQGKVIAFITSNIHATEIGASQMSLQFTYELATSEDPQINFYLENVILILMPSANPDGQLMVCDWYRKWLGTEYEGGRMPWLYHRYVGHDTNRDFFMLNQKESKLINRVMSRDWFPQVHLDEHQMGSRGPRMFVPPYKDPMSPNLSPLLMRLEALFGANMSFRLEEKDLSGVIDSWVFDSYWPGGTRTAAWKNIVSLLTELASCDVASPIFIEENELYGGGKGMAEYKQQINFPNPWKGGWWRLRDIIDYELVASYAFLETSAKFRESILRGFYQMNRTAIEQPTPWGYVIPPNQHDAITAAKLIDILLEHGIQLLQFQEDLIINNRIYQTGTVFIPLAQPLRSFISEMLDIQIYPEIRLSPSSDPLYPYDVTSWSLPLLMGVACDRIDQPVNVAMVEIDSAPYPEGNFIGASSSGYAISHQFNNTSIAINRLLREKFEVYAALQAFRDGRTYFETGTIVIPAQPKLEQQLKLWAKELHLPIHRLSQNLPESKLQLKPVRVGLYKPWRASMDEGWTRWLLEQFEFDLVSVTNEMIKQGQLSKRFDAIIIPDINKQTIIDPKPKDAKSAKNYRPLPEQYEGGIEKEGVDNLKKFVSDGGALIALDSGCLLPVDEFPLPVFDASENLNRSDYNAPGVMLKADIDTDHPLGWGMPSRFTAFVSNSPAFRTTAPIGDVDRSVIAVYPDESLLLSGWIKGEELLRKKAAVIDVKFGNGKVILLGFRVQHRAQPHGTFKLLFNAIHYAGQP